MDVEWLLCFHLTAGIKKRAVIVSPSDIHDYSSMEIQALGHSGLRFKLRLHTPSGTITAYSPNRIPMDLGLLQQDGSAHQFLSSSPK